MSSYIWHIKFAKVMTEIAEHELYKNNYVVINSVLKAFEEMIDAYCALSNLHFHEDPTTGWKNRIEWIKGKRLYYDWERIIYLINLYFKEKCEDHVEEVISIVKKNISIIELDHNI